jgi:glyoxylase-like metal-dependent hydrolase (beta-lactamase superfamily II)
MSTNIVNVGYDSTNYYVICPDGGQKLLVDCGWPGTMGTLKAQMARKDIHLQEVGYLLVTHFHPDHAGLTQELRNEGMRLLLLETQVPHVEKLKDSMKPANHYVDIIVKGSPVVKLAESRQLLESLGIQGEIVATPGHSPDSVSLVLDEGIAFTGDLTHKLLLSENDVECTESWQRIAKRGARMAYPAHGNIYFISEA